MDTQTKRPPLAARLMNGVEGAVSWAAGLALIGVALTIFFNATGRYLTGWSFLGGEELARLLTVWITFVGAFALVRHERHVNIDLVLRAVPASVQRLFRGMIAALGLLVMGYICWTSWKLTSFSFGTGQMGTTLPVPRGLFFLPVFVGSVLMLLAFAEILYRAIRGTLPPMQALGVEADEGKS